jgi:hypothetical protein
VSTNWPSPVRSRWSSAPRIPETANVPEIPSVSGVPALLGRPFGSPVMLIRPVAAWTIRS